MAPEQRREHLIDAALEVILERGYAGVSIEAIAREAGITRPVVYDHFPNLNRLLHAVIEREERISLEQLGKVVPENPGTTSRASCSPPGSRGSSTRSRAGPRRGASSCCHSKGRPRSSASTSRSTARVYSSGSSAGSRGVEHRHVPAQLDIELTARTFRDFSEQAGRMVLTDPERYPRERYERYAKNSWPYWRRASEPMTSVASAALGRGQHRFPAATAPSSPLILKDDGDPEGSPSLIPTTHPRPG